MLPTTNAPTIAAPPKSAVGVWLQRSALGLTTQPRRCARSIMPCVRARDTANVIATTQPLERVGGFILVRDPHSGNRFSYNCKSLSLLKMANHPAEDVIQIDSRAIPDSLIDLCNVGRSELHILKA